MVYNVNMICVGRQSIVNKGFNIIGYELLYRSYQDADRAVINDALSATASVIIGVFAYIGIEKLVGDKLCFINISKDVITSEFLCGIPRKDNIVLAITNISELKENIIDKIKYLKDNGFKIAVSYAESLKNMLELASFVDLDTKLVKDNEIKNTLNLLKKTTT